MWPMFAEGGGKRRSYPEENLGAATLELTAQDDDVAFRYLRFNIGSRVGGGSWDLPPSRPPRP
jgi:hypothetical protein